MTKRLRSLIAGFAGVLLVATACTSPGGQSASQTPAESEKPQQGGKIIQGDITDIATMQPILSADTSSSRIINLIYDQLIQQDYKNGRHAGGGINMGYCDSHVKFVRTQEPYRQAQQHKLGNPNAWDPTNPNQ